MGKGKNPGDDKAGGGAKARTAFFLKNYSHQNTLNVIQKMVRDILLKWNDKETSPNLLESRLDMLRDLDVEKSDPDIDCPKMILRLWNNPSSCFSKLDSSVSDEDIRLLIKETLIDSLSSTLGSNLGKDEVADGRSENQPKV